MLISRRKFNQATIAAGTSIVFGPPAALAGRSTLTRRKIPSSGQTVPIIGIGTNRFSAGTDPELRLPLKAALQTFHDMGGAVVDTAPGYRASEVVLGGIMRELDIRDDLFVATKVDVDDREASAERMQSSLERLQTAKIDLMQVHNLIGWQETLPLLQEWKQDGRIAYLGITTSRERQYELMEKIMRQFDLDFIQVNYSLANQRESAKSIIPLAAERGTAVMVNRPFGGGAAFRKLASTSIPGWATEIGISSWAQFLLKYVLSHPSVCCVIPGMTKQRHVIDNLAAAQGNMPTVAQRRNMEAFFDNI